MHSITSEFWNSSHFDGGYTWIEGSAPLIDISSKSVYEILPRRPSLSFGKYQRKDTPLYRNFVRPHVFFKHVIDSSKFFIFAVCVFVVFSELRIVVERVLLAVLFEQLQAVNLDDTLFLLRSCAHALSIVLILWRRCLYIAEDNQCPARLSHRANK